MIKINKTIVLAGNLVGSICLTHAEMVQITSKTSGTITTVTVHFAGSENTEAIKVQKVGTNWQVAEVVPGDYRTKVDITRPEEGIRFSIDGLNLNLTSGGFYLAGNWDGSLYFEHEGACKIAKGSRLEVTESLFLNKSILFENEGELRIGQDWTCLLTAIQNKGTIVVGQGWQVMALQKFTNEVNGNFAMQRADLVSPATEVNNRGNIACVLDWKGEPCTFNNIAGGQVQVGGNCTLKALNNKSEFEPQIGAFKESKRVLQDTSGNLVTDNRSFLLNWNGELQFDPKGTRNPSGYEWGFRDRCLNCKRVITNIQSFTQRQGRPSNFCVLGSLGLNQSSQVICSHLFIGNALRVQSTINIKAYATHQQIMSYVLNTRSAYFKGNVFGGGGRTVYWDSFVHANTQTSIHEKIPSTLELLGTSTGKIETFINGKADTTQAVVIKATEAKYEQHKNALEGLAAEKGIPLMLLVDEAEYEENLQAMKENPVFQTMVRQQELRQARSAAPSGAPSRSLTPEQK